jgi:hypothetical protein
MVGPAASRKKKGPPTLGAPGVTSNVFARYQALASD